MKKRILILILILLSLLGCSLFGSSKSQTPEAVVQSFMDAMAEQRLDDSSELMTPEYRQTYLANCKTATLTECSQKVYQRQGPLVYELAGSQVDGNLATVIVRARRGQEPQSCMQFTLNQIDGDWLLVSHQAWLCQ